MRDFSCKSKQKGIVGRHCERHCGGGIAESIAGGESIAGCGRKHCATPIYERSQAKKALAVAFRVRRSGTLKPTASGDGWGRFG